LNNTARNCLAKLLELVRVRQNHVVEDVGTVISSWGDIMKKLRSLLVIGVLLSAGCKTTLNVTSHNQTAYPLDVSVWVQKDDKATPLQTFQQTVAAGSTLASPAVGKYDVGSKIQIKMAMPTGGVVGRSLFELPSDPDPYQAEITVKTIAAENVDVSDAASIERQITDVTGSTIPPTSDIGTLLSAYLGGIYRKQGETFLRIFDPTELGSKVVLGDFMPDTGKGGLYSLKLVIDQANSGSVTGQVPQTVSFNLDWNKSLLYRYEFTMTNTAWHATPYSWHNIEQKLLSSDEGKKILSEVKARIAKGEDLYYLSSGFVIGDMLLNVSTAEAINADANVDASDIIQGGVVFKWHSDNADTKEYRNLVLRVRFDQLNTFIEEPTGTNGSILTPTLVEREHGVIENNTAELLQKHNLTIDDLKIVPSHTWFTGKTKIKSAD